MKRAFPLTCTIHILILAALFGAQSVFSQVGIGTTNPNPNALLDIDATTIPGGLLLPRIALTNSTSPAPLSAHVPGMVVYNTATVADVIPGFYFNDGGDWVRVDAAIPPSDDWTTGGNAGTVPGTQFIGTTDNQGLRFRTNNSDRIEITNNGRLRSFSNGNAAQPSYSFTADPDIGMYRIGTNSFGFSSNGVERLRLDANSITFNEPSNDYDFRIKTQNQQNLFFIDGATDRIGIQTNSPSYSLHMVNSGNIGATALAQIQNSGIEGVSLSSYNTGTSNGYNAFEGITEYSGTTFVPSGIFGLAIATSGAAYGVRGVSNSSDGIGVRGAIPTTGTWLGFGGLFTGGLGYTNGLYDLSDAKVKENIEIIDFALEKIKQLNGVSYNYKMEKFNPKNSNDSRKYYGFIAQNVKEHLPYAVAQKKIPFDDSIQIGLTDHTAQHQVLDVVNYTAIVPVLVEAIKQQQDQIDLLTEKIRKLEKKN